MCLRRDVVNVFAPRMRTFADKPKRFKPDQAISRTKSRILPDQAISRTMSRNLGKSAKSIKAQSTWMDLATKIQVRYLHVPRLTCRTTNLLCCRRRSRDLCPASRRIYRARVFSPSSVPVMSEMIPRCLPACGARICLQWW